MGTGNFLCKDHMTFWTSAQDYIPAFTAVTKLKMTRDLYC